VLDLLKAAFRDIAANPGIGRERADITSDARIRFWSVPPSLIAYRVANMGEEAVVEVLFVERGEREWGAVLDERF